MLLYLSAARRRRIILPVTVGLALMLAFALLLALRFHGWVRDFSVRQALANVSSITGQSSSDQFSGTVQWREGMWGQVATDLRTSETCLSGIGFGPIPLDRYNVDVGNTNNPDSAAPLRSVHNSHLTLLARAGVPAFALWLLLWVVWCHQLARSIRRRPGRRQGPCHRPHRLAPCRSAGVPGQRDLRPGAGGPPLRHLAVHHRRGRRRARLASAGHWAGGGMTAPTASRTPLRNRIGRLTARAGWGVADQACPA